MIDNNVFIAVFAFSAIFIFWFSLFLFIVFRIGKHYMLKLKVNFKQHNSTEED